MAFYSSISTLVGALHVNRSFAGRGAAQDPGGKIAALISAVNILNATVSTLNTSVSTIGVVLLSANASGSILSSLTGVTFSATTSTYGTIGNFTS